MSHPSRAENTKKCTKKCDTRAELLLYLSETYSFFFLSSRGRGRGRGRGRV